MANEPKPTTQRKTGLLLSLQKTYERFLKIRGTPREIALGFALGLFVGMSPTMGVQMPIAVFFAALLKWNKISAAVGVWISNPLTAPFLYGMTFYVGAAVTGVTKAFSANQVLDFDLVYQILVKAPEIFLSLLIGGIIAGIPVALAGYYFSFKAVNRYQEGIKKKLAKQKERLAFRKEQRRLRRIDKRKRKDRTVSVSSGLMRNGNPSPTGGTSGSRQRGGDQLTVYAADWCYHCRETVKFLREQQIAFEYIDIEAASQEVVDQVIAVNGGEDWVVPTLAYNGQWREGKEFDREELLADLTAMGVLR